MTDDLINESLEKIVAPTVKALAAAGHPYKGVLYAGLILTEQGPKLIEYNARFGDPETQVMMMRMDCDLLPMIMACADGTLKQQQVRWKNDAALTVVLAAEGYPGNVKKGSPINNLDKEFDKSVQVFHAGTAMENGRLVSSGGRVLNVTATGPSIKHAQKAAYAAVDKVDFPDGFCRRDIGWRAVT